MSRFASLPLNRTALQVHRSTSRSVWSGVHGVRCFCQQEIQTSNQTDNDQTERLSLRVPDLSAFKTNETRAGFYQELKECRSPSDILDLVDRCKVAPWCISNSLTRMWHVTKKMPDERRHWELRLMAEHPTFEKLCHSARMSAPRMNCHNLAFTLLSLVKLGVSQRSYVVQTILRVIQVSTLPASRHFSLSGAVSLMVLGSRPRT